MNRILHAALAITLLGGSSALAQTESPAHRELSEPAAAGGPGNLTAGGEQRVSPNLREEPAPRQSEAAAVNRGHRLSDPKSGCAGFDAHALPVDAITWSGNCVDGLASGPGTMTFSSQGKFFESLAGDFDHGVALNGYVKVKFANGSSYEGDKVAARKEGTGLLTTVEGDRLQGQWANDRLNGPGVVTWANGDRYEGEWRDGKAEGRGIQTWADGRRYDGGWRNDLPNGHGVVTRKDGSRYEGTFADGHPSGVTEMAAEAPAVAATAAPAMAPVTVATNTAEAATANGHNATDDGSRSSSIDQFSDKKLSAVDGSTFVLTPTEGGLKREIVAPDGAVKKTLFEFLSDKLGSVHEGDDGGAVAGVFRVTATGVAVDYADGRSESLILNRAGGVSMILKTPTGAAACMAWYPEGHRFSIEERRAAVAAYAGRIGLHEPRGRKSGAAAKPSCDLPAAELAPVTRARAQAPKPHSRRHANAGAQAVMVSSLVAPSALDPGKPIVVPTSQVHAIDGDVPLPAETADQRTTASNQPAPVAGGTSEASASACLNVESDGRHWGFRNRCTFDVQFAYCLMNAGDPLTSCGEATVSGSVAASGFGSLIADQGLHETDADHDFRWVACGGGAGEVVAHLDRSNPPAGRCVRPRAS